jgi:NAD(P)-dependent dehydrogenase (short-subunit alcohol dehydrogenase family)
LVTGASRGIGESIALTLAKEGCDLALCSNASSSEPTAEAVRALGRRAVAIQADIATPEGIDKVVSMAQQSLGAIDLLVNNAGVAKRVLMKDMQDGAFERVLAVNLTGPFQLCRRLVPSMVERGFGRVVNVSSISGTLGTPGFTAYCASKWGLSGLTQALSEELRGTGVFVAAVLPGTVNTKNIQGMGFPIQMEPEDVAELVRYLCTQAPAAMRGSLVEIFG